MINFLFIGPNRLYFNNQLLVNDTNSAIFIMPPLFGTNSTTILFAFIVSDVLLSFGAGLVVGRNLRIINYQYQERKAGP
jgi:hypothetical protein